MEILFEILLEFVGPALSGAIGLALGSVAFAAMTALRRTMAQVTRRSEVRAPQGETWSVRVVHGLGQPLSKRLAGMTPDARAERGRADADDASVGRGEIWHPKRLLDAFDELAGIAAPFIVLAAIAIGFLFVVELLIAVPIGLAFLAVSSIRGRWQVEIIDPLGHRTIADAGTLADARAVAAQSAAQIAGGTAPVAQGVDSKRVSRWSRPRRA